MRGQRLRYFGALAAMAAAAALAYLVPKVCQLMLDSVIAGKSFVLPQGPAWIEAWAAQSSTSRIIWTAALVMLALSCLSGLLMFLKGRHAALAAEAIARRMRDTLYRRLQHAPCAYFDKRDTGDLVQRCTSDVETVRAFLATQVVEILHAIVLVLTVLPIMLHEDARMTLACTVVLPPIVVFAIVFFIKVKSAFLKSDEAEGRMTSALQENLTGIRVVRAFARQDFERGKFAKRIADYRDTTFRLIHLLAWYWSISDFLCFLQRGIALIAAAWMVGAGEGALTVGKLYMFVWYVNMFLWPVRNMGRILTDTGKTLVALGRLNDILSQAPEDAPPVAASPAAPAVAWRASEPPRPEEACVPPAAGWHQAGGTLAAHAALASPVTGTKGDGADGANGRDGAAATRAIAGEIVFQDVTFGYQPDLPVLQGVSFAVRAGQTLGILGPSGSGKSTLIGMLLRLYEHQGGLIAIDGRDLRTLDRKFLRRQIGVVMQEPFLFSKTLRDNLKLGRMTASDAEMTDAARAACIHDGIAGFEKGYDTLVGERGVTLSGGQRQRVAIARALLKQPAVLVLDDALSAVDTRTEALILQALKARRGRHTTLIVAHRLSTLMHADAIVVLDKGRVIQAGTHESLVRCEGLYRRLWRIQASLEEGH